MLECFKDANKPMCKDNVILINQVNKDIGEDVGQTVAAIECTVCTNEELAIFTSALEVEDLKCRGCDRLSLVIKEDKEWEQKL